jgi:sugar/nucleoside kinase (ribokinase family)
VIGRARHVHTSNLPHLSDRVRTLAVDRGLLLSYDSSTFDLPIDLRGIEIVYRSSGESRDVASAIRLATDTLDRGARLAVVTLGSGASIAMTTGVSDVIRQAATSVDCVVDTCGAGDAFIAA